MGDFIILHVLEGSQHLFNQIQELFATKEFGVLFFIIDYFLKVFFHVFTQYTELFIHEPKLV